MPESPFQNPDRVRRQMDLPGVVTYSFVGDSSPKYHAQLEEIVARIVGEDNIRRREFKPSSGGSYTAYRFEVFHMEFEEVEQLYREVGRLSGTKFVL